MLALPCGHVLLAEARNREPQQLCEPVPDLQSVHFGAAANHICSGLRSLASKGAALPAIPAVTHVHTPGVLGFSVDWQSSAHPLTVGDDPRASVRVF